MAFDLQNQDIEQLLMALSGGQFGNQLTQPGLENMPVSPSPQPQQPGLDQLGQQGIPPQLAQLMGGVQQPPQQLGQNLPQDFQGMGLGATAPQFQQPQLNIQDLMAMLQGQGMGGF